MKNLLYIFLKIKSLKILLLILGVFFLHPSVLAESSSRLHMSTAKWETGPGVTKLYSTPLGTVFRFNYSDYYYFHYDQKKDKDKNKSLFSIQFELPEFYRNKKERYRFVIIDFIIRTFPAISKRKKPELHFVLTRSLNSPQSISKYKDLNGYSHYNNSGIFAGISKLSGSLYGGTGRMDNWSLMAGYFYCPYYEPVTVRLVFDNKKGGVVATSINGSSKYIIRHQEITKIYPKGNTYGICIQRLQNKREQPREILEISKPNIYFTNFENELKDLPEIQIKEYPYESYPEIDNKIRRIKNPDWLYAHALKLLKIGNLPEAVTALERAAKKEHVLAMYQLGVCCYRGYGVNKDIKKATKWLQKAAEYSLPDAFALLGLLSFKKAHTAYLHEANKKRIFKCLDSLPKGKSKHDNWVMSFMFYNKGHKEAFLKNEPCSPKLAFWLARSLYIREYYKPVLETEYRNSVENTRLGHQKLKSPTHNRSKFYDIRIDGIPVTTREPEFLEKALKANFIPAILYKGRLQKDDNKALEFFSKGEKLGSILCALEALHCKARLGKLSKNDFDIGADIRFSDYPLYYMLRYMVRNPNASGVKEFLEKKYEQARRIWRKSSLPWSKFLLASEALYQYFNYGNDTTYYFIYWRKTQKLDEAFANLGKAAKAGITPALYLSGMYYLKGTQNKGRINLGESQGDEMLNKAINKGHIKAKFLLIKTKFDSQHYADRKWIKELSILRKNNFPDAWLLTTDIFKSLTKGDRNSAGKIIKGYKKAVELGCYLALDRLANIHYTGKLVNKNKKIAAKYWKLFISKDKQQREQDINDIYYGKIKSPVILTFDKKGLPVPRSATGRNSKEQKKYFNTY